MLDRRSRAAQVLIAIVTLAGLLTGCEANSGEGRPPAPAAKAGSSMHPSKIAFSGNGGPSGSSVFVMNSDGTGVTRIAAGYEPDFARDGSKIVIRHSSGSGLVVMNPDGSNPVQLVDDGSNPEFSTDGTHVVFVCHRSICVVDADGTNRKTLTPNMGERLNYPNTPTFSPDGSRIAFTLGRDLWLMNADGTNLRQLLDDAITPAFTSDGSGIVFASERGGHNRTETYHMDTASGEIRPLTGEGTALLSPDPYHTTTLPAFSPDGTHLLVTRSIRNAAKVMTGSEIWVMNPDGSDPRRLTEPNQPATWPTWGGNPGS